MRIGDVVVACLAVFVGAGKLLNHELVIWHIAVERANDPIAVAPGIANRAIAFEAARLAIADKVEPMPPPSFAIARIVEPTVNQRPVGVR